MNNIRTCIACRTKKQKQDFLRIVAVDNVAVLDKTKKANTRGIYVCDDKVCINRLLKAKDITKYIKINATCDSVKELLKNLGE